MKKEEKPQHVEEAKEPTPTEEEVSEAEEQKLPFPTATLVREMKKYISQDKMVKKEVKIGMNKFLGEVVKEVSERLDKYPYAMLDYRMLEEAARPFRKVKEMQHEKERLVARLSAIISDCESFKRDLESKFAEQKD